MESRNKNFSNYQKTDNIEPKETSTVDRKWVALTAYQPVDVVTKTVEVPVIKTVEKIVPKTILQEKIVHVPKSVTHVVEKIVEVPEVKYIEKVVEVPHIHYKNKYVPKIEVVEKIIERQKIIEKWHDKIVEVPQIKEVVRFKQIEDAEEIIKYIPKNSGNIDWEAEYRKYMQRKELSNYNVDNAATYQQKIKSYNDYNENAYTQNAYDRTYEYMNNQASLNEPTDYSREAYSQGNYYNQYNRANYDQQQSIPRSNFDVSGSVQIKRLPSEDAKPVGCCAGACS
ncbi:inner membrane complex protein 1c, putative [Plasmodium relictum]|uniref:Inner membrane complex protein 1c, putative n=1 Tax=Plasmodium relictum TaxID=85471 RepID=A0A1J1H3W0_PLARL|nr:inner membrane complex protein 1c, putative [Plasmodium relictum]CRG99588.1 inner membrane complex protein 1c, putative [Plasmodium relictum]